MRIGSESIRQEAMQRNVNFQNAAGNFSDIMAKIKEDDGKRAGSRDSYAGSADYGNPWIYENPKADAVRPINAETDIPAESVRYKIEDESDSMGVPAYRIVDKLTGRAICLREDELSIQQDYGTGMKFLVDMDQPLMCNLVVTAELEAMLGDLAERRGIDIEETSLKGGLEVHYDPDSKLHYMTIKGEEAYGVHVILTSEKDVEAFNKLVDEYRNYSVCSDQSIAGLYALLDIGGLLKRDEGGFTLTTPNGIRYIPYDGDPAKAWSTDVPESLYSFDSGYLEDEDEDERPPFGIWARYAAS